MANVNWGFERSASYQQVTSKLEGVARWGIKVEFVGFIGGFGKIFFTKGGIKREKEGFWGWIGAGKRRGGRREGFLGYVWERMICTLYGNKSELQ